MNNVIGKFRDVKEFFLRHEKLIHILIIAIALMTIKIYQNSHVKLQGSVTEIEYKFDRLLESNDQISEALKNTEKELKLASSTPYWGFIKKYCDKYNVDPILVKSIIDVESAWDIKAKSPAGAMGLMQLMPSTYKWIKSKFNLSGYHIYDPETNIKVGVRYLSYLNKAFKGDDIKVLAYYNGGYRQVESYPNCAKETLDYVTRVLVRKSKTMATI